MIEGCIVLQPALQNKVDHLLFTFRGYHLSKEDVRNSHTETYAKNNKRSIDHVGHSHRNFTHDTVHVDKSEKSTYISTPGIIGMTLGMDMH